MRRNGVRGLSIWRICEAILAAGALCLMPSCGGTIPPRCYTAMDIDEHYYYESTCYETRTEVCAGSGSCQQYVSDCGKCEAGKTCCRKYTVEVPCLRENSRNHASCSNYSDCNNIMNSYTPHSEAGNNTWLVAGWSDCDGCPCEGSKKVNDGRTKDLVENDDCKKYDGCFCTDVPSNCIEGNQGGTTDPGGTTTSNSVTVSTVSYCATKANVTPTGHWSKGDVVVVTASYAASFSADDVSASLSKAGAAVAGVTPTVNSTNTEVEIPYQLTDADAAKVAAGTALTLTVTVSMSGNSSVSDSKNVTIPAVVPTSSTLCCDCGSTGSAAQAKRAIRSEVQPPQDLAAYRTDDGRAVVTFRSPYRSTRAHEVIEAGLGNTVGSPLHPDYFVLGWDKEANRSGRANAEWLRDLVEAGSPNVKVAEYVHAPHTNLHTVVLDGLEDGAEYTFLAKSMNTVGLAKALADGTVLCDHTTLCSVNNPTGATNALEGATCMIKSVEFTSDFEDAGGSNLLREATGFISNGTVVTGPEWKDGDANGKPVLHAMSPKSPGTPKMVEVEVELVFTKAGVKYSLTGSSSTSWLTFSKTGLTSTVGSQKAVLRATVAVPSQATVVDPATITWTVKKEGVTPQEVLASASAEYPVYVTYGAPVQLNSGMQPNTPTSSRVAMVMAMLEDQAVGGDDLGDPATAIRRLWKAIPDAEEWSDRYSTKNLVPFSDIWEIVEAQSTYTGMCAEFSFLLENMCGTLGIRSQTVHVLPSIGKMRVHSFANQVRKDAQLPDGPAQPGDEKFSFKCTAGSDVETELIGIADRRELVYYFLFGYPWQEGEGCVFHDGILYPGLLPNDGLLAATPSETRTVEETAVDLVTKMEAENKVSFDLLKEAGKLQNLPDHYIQRWAVVWKYAGTDCSQLPPVSGFAHVLASDHATEAVPSE